MRTRTAAADGLPLIFAVAVYLIAVGWLVRAGIALSDGHFAYPLDDTYIHLAVARNFVEHGVWGVNVHEAVSASSSPLWTLLLALGGAIGIPFVWLPLILNVLAGLFLLWAADACFTDVEVPPALRTLALLSLIAVVPLPTLTVSGMEHTLHAALCVVFLLAVRRSQVGGSLAVPIAVAAVMPLVRFESGALVAAASLMLWSRHGWRALSIAGAAALAVAAFVAISLVNGWMWLPNSVLLKSSFERPQSLIWFWSRFLEMLEQLQFQPERIGATLALVALHTTGLAPTRVRNEALLVVFAILAHAAFVRANWFWRYEAYLIAMAIVSLVSSGWAVTGKLRASRVSWRHAAVLAAVIAIGLAAREFRLRAAISFGETPTAMRNIYDQQIQSARFIREYLTVSGPIVINDLGLVAFAGTRPVVDFVGLGDTTMARLWLDDRVTADAIEQRAREAGSRVAVVYIPWLEFAGGIPKSWIKVGEWTIDDNVVAGESAVTVFATAPEVASQLHRDFTAFARTLPPRTLVTVVDPATGPGETP